MFSGNKALFEDALETGEVIERDGKFYYDEDYKTADVISATGWHGKRRASVADGDWLSVMAECMDVMNTESHDWVKFGDTKSSKSIMDGLASDEDFRILQASFDSGTQVTNSIKQVE